jgi:hypothetical protein
MTPYSASFSSNIFENPFTNIYTQKNKKTKNNKPTTTNKNNRKTTKKHKQLKNTPKTK